MWFTIIFIGLFLYLIIDNLLCPWHFVGGNSEDYQYNIFGKNKYGETKEERYFRFDEEIKCMNKALQKRSK